MADYNIYIHTVGASNQNANPTTPWQLRGGEGEGGANGGNGAISGGFSPASTVKRGAAFLSNPDSLIAGVLATSWGKLGVAGVVIATVINITDKVVTMYNGYASVASGDYKFAIDYNNFKNAIHNAFHPFSNEIQRQQNALQIKKDNLKNEQERLLLGGSFINSPYGRYL